jgi:hypothetical protein
MIKKHSRELIALALTFLLLSLVVPVGSAQQQQEQQKQSERNFDDYWGGRYSARSQTLKAAEVNGTPSTNAILHWNKIAVDCSGLDHTPVTPGEQRVFGEQLGPCRAACAMAIVHIAMFETVNAITGGSFKSYIGMLPANPSASIEAAVAQAAHDTLVGEFPSQKYLLDPKLDDILSGIPDSGAKTSGINVGRLAAKTTLALRAHDGSKHTEPRIGIEYIPGTGPGVWRQDPIGHQPIALGARWNEVTPFVLTSPSLFRLPPPPALNSAAYTAAYNEVKSLGGDGLTTPTTRTPDQSFTGVFWAYDGTPSLCAPPRLYNQIAVQLAGQMGTTGVNLARLLALLNVAMADAGIASWESKFFYKFWRPVGGIRESDAGTGPTGAGDGNANTVGDLTFTPLGAPASNLTGPNFTPPFPSYPSGHATFGGALFEMLRQFYGTDDIPFTFVSDEFNGVTVDNQGNVRPLIPRHFNKLSQAEEENGQSRIYLGIHWAFDKTGGISQGRNVSRFIAKKLFLPTGKTAKSK